MRSFLPPFSAALAACAPAPQEALRGLDRAGLAVPVVNGGLPGAQATPHPGTSTDLSPTDSSTDGNVAAQGRRILSTAFVRLGPGGHLLVTLRSGDVLALRDATMEKRAFCGVPIADGASGKRQCHGYVDVVAAQAVDAATGGQAASADAGIAARERTPDRQRPDRPAPR